MTARRPALRRRPRVRAVLLVAYAATAGALLAGASSPVPGGSGGSGAGVLGRPVSAASALPPVVDPAADPAAAAGAAAGADQGAADPGAVPPAALGRAVPADPPFRPSLLVLPGGVRAPVVDVGLHPDGSLAIPDDPATVGRWDGGALAGDAFGGVVLAGHVDSARYGLGVMARLKALRTGDGVELRAADRVLRYRVTARRSVPQAELGGATDAFRQDVAPRLVLITCGGAFDPARHRYQDNLLVYADPVPGG